jgi:hypothetical protein
MMSQPSSDEPAPETPREIDTLSLMLALATVLVLGWAAWLRFGPAPAPPPLEVGNTMPPLRLIDLETSEPKLMFGLKGRVLWVVFISAGSKSGEEALAQLAPVWKRLRPHRAFSLAVAAVESDQPARVRAVLEKEGKAVPTYLADPETRARFGAEEADPPVHLLIDPDGRVAVVMRGAGQATIDRLANQAQNWLEELDPLGNSRFAAQSPESRRSSRDSRGIH